MRVILGAYRGRVIRMPAGIRPTQNKVRKAIFDILQDVAGLSFLELFAGSGAIGIEALSKAAQEVVFVERDKRCAKAINGNLELLACGNCGRVWVMDAAAAVEKFSRDKKRFDIVFLDPPYRHGTLKKALQTLFLCDILRRNGLIVAQHFKRDDLPETPGDLVLFKQKRYGDTVLSFYRKRDYEESPVILPVLQ